jgi:hypothetical protein
MSRQTRGRTAVLLVTLALLATPALAAAAPRAQTTHPAGISRFLTFLWRSFVQIAPPAADATDRGASLDPWG